MPISNIWMPGLENCAIVPSYLFESFMKGAEKSNGETCPEKNLLNNAILFIALLVSQGCDSTMNGVELSPKAQAEVKSIMKDINDKCAMIADSGEYIKSRNVRLDEAIRNAEKSFLKAEEEFLKLDILIGMDPDKYTSRVNNRDEAKKVMEKVEVSLRALELEKLKVQKRFDRLHHTSEKVMFGRLQSVFANEGWAVIGNLDCENINPRVREVGGRVKSNRRGK